MALSKLSSLLKLIEKSSGAMSIRELAKELDLSRERVEMMLGFWVQKGRIKGAANPAECESCASHGGCPFIIDLPRTYQLAGERDGEQEGLLKPGCK